MNYQLEEESQGLFQPNPLNLDIPIVNLLTIEQLYRSMQISDSIVYPYTKVYEMVRSISLSHRASAIFWMKKVMNKDPCEVRDTGIRIFDTYLINTYFENSELLQDTCWIAFAAAASMILSYKLHNSRQPITASRFTSFNTADIVFFEHQIVMKIGSRIASNSSPASFLQYAVSLCEGIADQMELLSLANSIIGDFLCESTSLLFAPSTIAISAVIVTLSIFRVDCHSFLDKLPEFLLPNRPNFDLFLESNDKAPYLDCQSCVSVMEKLPSVRVKNQRSPTSVADETIASPRSKATDTNK